MKNQKVLVVGDSCKDVYIYGNCERLCPDGPVPVFIPLYEKTKEGMASNVYNNLKSLGVDCDIVTNKKNITKNRYVDDKTNQLIVRVDLGETQVDRIDITKLELDKYAGVIISDYMKGFLLESDIEYICNNHPNVLIDTKKILGEFCKNATFIKVNEHEYKASKHILDKYIDLNSSLIITLGSKGCSYKDKIYSVKKVEVKDQTGAGDTFVAGFMAKYLSSKSVDQSIKFANECSTKVVQKRGTTII